MAILGPQLDALRAQYEPIIRAEIQRGVAQSINGLVEGLRQGQALPDLIPTAPAPVDVKADARSRATRTFMQNLGIDVATTLLATLATALFSLDVTSQEAWLALGALLLKTLLSAPISYVMRVKFGVKDTTLPTPPSIVVPVAVSPISPATDAPPVDLFQTNPPITYRGE